MGERNWYVFLTEERPDLKWILDQAGELANSSTNYDGPQEQQIAALMIGAYIAGLKGDLEIAEQLAKDNWGFAARESACEEVATAIRSRIAQLEKDLG